MTRKQELFWGVGVLLIGLAAWLIFRAKVLPIVRENSNEWLPGISIPDFDLGDFMFPTRDRMKYGGFFPCGCGCDANNVTGSDFLDGLPAALSDLAIGSNSMVETAPGRDPHTVGPAVYFSEVPTGRGPRSIH